MSRLLTSEEADEFKKLLSNYKLHQSVLDQFRRSNFGVIAGPAGAGKDTLRDSLIKKYPYSYNSILSTTTRPARAGELDGVTYHFREIEEVAKALRQHKYFQAELVHDQQISCLDIDEVLKLNQSQIGLSILITEAEKKLRIIKSDIKTIFLIPPNLEELKHRMQAERLLDDREIQRRLEAAKKEIGHALEAEHYFCLISSSIENATEQAHFFYKEGQINNTEDSEARRVLSTILSSIS